jgi:predicted molibdopterin-dependent oxidoreductase YjgC
VRTTCGYCGVGCQLCLHVKDNRVVKVTGVEEASPNHGSLCVKGRFGFDFVGSPDRLKTPLIRENGKFREATWDEALDFVARRLGQIETAHGPDRIGVLTSARITNEENYIAQKFTRAVLKTNNIDHCARL